MWQLLNTLTHFIWQRRERRPLVIPFLGIPVLIILTHLYTGWTWRDALLHWATLRGSALIIIISSSLYWYWHPAPAGFTPNPRRRPRHTHLLFLACVVFALLIILLSIPRPLPSDRLVVTIAQFAPVTDAAKEKAGDIADRIEEDLLAKARQGAPLEVKLINEPVTGTDERSQQAAALALGKSWQGNANVIFWGQVRDEENELFVKWHMTVVRQLKDTQVENQGENFLDRQPDHLEAEEHLSAGVADLLTLAYGLSYYKAQQWTKAIEMLSSVQAKRGQLYKGLSLVERSRESPNPPPDLNAAISTYDLILGSNELEPISPSVDQLTMAAILDRAIARAMLARYSQPNDAVSLLKQAVETFHSALPVVALKGQPRESAAIERDLDIAAAMLSSATGNGDVQKLPEQQTSTTHSLGGAPTDPELLKHWQQAAERCRLLPRSKQTAASEMDCGDVFRAVAASLGGYAGDKNTPLRVKLFNESITAWQAALDQRPRGRFPQTWATLENKLGLVLLAKGSQVTNSDPELNAMKAADAFRSLSDVWTRDACQICWALAQNNLAEATSLQSIQSTGKARETFGREAIQHWKSAQDVFKPKVFPAAWADIQGFIIGFCSWLSGMVEAQQGKDLLDEAGQDYRELLRVLFESKLSQGYDPGFFLKQALLAMRGRDGDTNGDLLKQAVAAERERLHYWAINQPVQTKAAYEVQLGFALFRLYQMCSDAEGKTALLRQMIPLYKSAVEDHRLELKPGDRFAAREGIIDGQIRLAALVSSPEAKALLQDCVSRSRDLVSTTRGKVESADAHYMLGVSLLDLAGTQSSREKTRTLRKALSSLDSALALLKDTNETDKRDSISRTRLQAVELLGETLATKP